jgi:PhoH-like ATPase
MNIQSVGKKLFVLDTNVLMHDPTSLFRFQEHNIFIPMVVLEELDHGKKGISDVSRNVRQVSRFLDELICDASQAAINEGLPLARIEHGLTGEQELDGRLFLQTRQLSHLLPDDLPGQIADNSILSIVLALTKEYPDVNVILVSKDINMRIKAAALQINAEDYHNDQTIEDIDLLYSGALALSPDFWEDNGGKMESWQENNHTYYRIFGPDVAEWYPNQFVYMDDESGFEVTFTASKGE